MILKVVGVIVFALTTLRSSVVLLSIFGLIARWKVQFYIQLVREVFGLLLILSKVFGRQVVFLFLWLVVIVFDELLLVEVLATRRSVWLFL